MTVPSVSAKPLVGILALQGDVREHEAALQSVGALCRRVRRPRDLEGLDGIVLPGGESTTMGLLLREFGLLDPLRDAVRAGLPTFGSCAGMVLLADTVVDGIPGQPLVGGMDVVVRRNAFGRQVDSFEGPVRVTGVADGPVHAVFIRAPWVEHVGPKATTLATLGDQVHGRMTGQPPGPYAGRVVAVRQDRLLATAFHPELTGDTRLHRLFLEIIDSAPDASGGARGAEGAS